jgi:hypothetical protein
LSGKLGDPLLVDFFQAGGTRQALFAGADPIALAPPLAIAARTLQLRHTSPVELRELHIETSEAG